MRKYLLAAIMAASALVPAAAFAQDHREWHGGGGQRGQGGQRPQGQPQAQPQARPQAPQAQAPQPQAAQPQAPRFQGRGGDGYNRPQYQGGRGGQPMMAAPAPGQQPGAQPQRFGGGDRRGWQGTPGQPGGQPQGFQGRDGDGGRGWQGNPGQAGVRPQGLQGRDGDGRNWQGGDRDGRGQPGGAGWQGNDPRRDDRGNWQGRGNDRGQSFGGNRNDRGGWNRGNPGFGGNNGRDWNRDWRRDNRYNYNAYRSSNRGAYHLPRYYAPSGWGYGYRRFGIGLTLDSILYNQSYWIDDADYYRLPPAYGPYRWVRYYNDALLVDIYTGQVVDTVYDIFW